MSLLRNKSCPASQIFFVARVSKHFRERPETLDFCKALNEGSYNIFVECLTHYRYLIKLNWANACKTESFPPNISFSGFFFFFLLLPQVRPFPQFSLQISCKCILLVKFTSSLDPLLQGNLGNMVFSFLASVI